MNGRLRVLNVSEATSRLALFVEKAGASNDQIDGRLEGPFCIYARTAPTYYRWRPLPQREPSTMYSAFAAEIYESCLWEPVHPFLYLGEWKLPDEPAGHRLRVGLRALTIPKNRLLLNGQPYFLRGLTIPADVDIDEEKLRRLHQWRCTLLTGPKFSADDRKLLEALDQFGPFCGCPLPDPAEQATATLDVAGPSRPSIGLWFFTGDSADAAKLHEHDRCSLFALRTAAEDAGSTTRPDGIDLLWVEGARAQLLEAAPRLADHPWIASVTDVAIDWNSESDEEWSATATSMDDAFFDRAGCIGWSIAGTKKTQPKRGESANGHA